MNKFSVPTLGLFGFLSLVGCAPQPDFHVDLTLVDEEVSEDSNSVTETLVIDGYKGSYHWVYDGYHPSDDFDTDREYDFRLSDEDLQMLTLLIRENGLLVPREETVPTEDWWRGFEVTWDITLDGQNATGHVLGVPFPDAESQEEVMEDETYFAAEQVMVFVRDKVEGLEVD